MPVPRSMNCLMPAWARNRTERTRNSRLSLAIFCASGTSATSLAAASRSAAKLSLPPSRWSYMRATLGTVTSIPAGTRGSLSGTLAPSRAIGAWPCTGHSTEVPAARGAAGGGAALSARPG